MLPFLRQSTSRWALWILGASALLFANPALRFGWAEWAAALAPLALAVDRRIDRELALALGLPLLTLLVLLDPGEAVMLRLVVVWLVFSVGVALAARAIDRQVELESLAGRIASGAPEPDPRARFARALERELGRARRHERPFAVLSVDVDPGSLSGRGEGPLTDEFVRLLAAERARLELAELLTDALHVYAEVVVDGERVLALVPELDEAAAPALVERLRARVDGELRLALRIGRAGFPADALSADDLIRCADQGRTGAVLRSLPERMAGSAGASIARDLQG